MKLEVNIMKHKINSVIYNSIADQLEIQPGDYLLSVNDTKPKDIIDYNLLQAGETVTLYIEKQSGQQYIFDIEKEYNEDLGIIFEKPTLERVKKL